MSILLIYRCKLIIYTFSVPKKIQEELSADPINSIRAVGVKGKAEMCFFEPEVGSLHFEGKYYLNKCF